MIIKIPDELSGKEKRRRVIVEQVLYAMTLLENKKKAAKFLGYSRRGLQKIISRYDELKEFKEASWEEKMPPNIRENYLRKMRLYPNE